MNRNTLIGFSLIAVVLILFSYLNTPSQEEIEAYNRQQDSIEAVKKQIEASNQNATEAKPVAVVDSTALFFPSISDSAAAAKGAVTLKNDSLELTVNTKGGTLASARIIAHKDTMNQPGIALLDAQGQQMNFVLKGLNKYINTKELNFSDSIAEDGSLLMTAQAQNGGSLVFKYTLGPDYMLHFSLQANGLADQLDPTSKELTIQWQDSCRQQEKGFTFENYRSALTYKFSEGGTDYLSETSDKKETIDEPIDWVAFKNQYFSAVLISKDAFNAGA